MCSIKKSILYLSADYEPLVPKDKVDQHPRYDTYTQLEHHGVQQHCNGGPETDFSDGQKTDTNEMKGSQNGPSSFRSLLRDNLLLVLCMIGVVVGFVLGFGIRPLKPSEDAMLWIGRYSE